MPEKRDLDKSIKTTLSLVPAARTASANGTGVDLANFERVAVVFAFGVATDGTHTPKLQDSPDNATFTDVAAGLQSGTLSAVTSGSGGSATQEVGYLGNQRYLRAVITVAGATTGALTSAVVVAAGARTEPQ